MKNLTQLTITLPLGKITADKKMKNYFLTLEHGIKNNSSEIYLLNEENTSLELAYFEDLAAYISLNLPGYEGKFYCCSRPKSK